MATITERKNKAGESVYRVRVRKKGHPIQTATFKRKTDAKNWAKSIESAIDERRHFKSAESTRRTLAELIDRYLQEKVIHLSNNEVRNRTQQLVYWREQLGGISLADVSTALIVEQRDRLASRITANGRQRTPATVNRYLAALSLVFTVAVKNTNG